MSTSQIEAEAQQVAARDHRTTKERATAQAVTAAAATHRAHRAAQAAEGYRFTVAYRDVSTYERRGHAARDFAYDGTSWVLLGATAAA